MATTVDDLKQRLAALDEASQTDTDIRQKIDTLNALARELKFVDPASSLDYSQKAVELSQTAPFATEPYPKGRTESLLLIGMCNHLLGNYGQALTALLEAESRAEAIGDLRSQAEAMLNVAQTYNLLGSLPIALDYALKAIDKCRQAGYPQGEAGAYNSAGIIYDKLGNRQLSLDALQKSLQIHRETSNQSGEAVLLNDIAMNYYTSLDFERALDSAHQCLQLTQQMHLDTLEANVTCTIGEIHLARGDADIALGYFQKSIVLSQRLSFTYLEMYALMCSGQLYLQREEVDQALPVLEQALEIAKRIDTKSELYQCHQLLAQCYKLKGEFETALSHHEQFHLVYQNVFNKESDTRTRHLQIAHETETAQKEAEIYRLKSVDLEREITQRELFETELQQANDKLWALRHVDNELTSRLDVNHVLSVALKAAMQMSEAEGGGIWLAEREDFRLKQRAGVYPENLIASRLPLETGIYARLLSKPEAVLIPDISADPGYVAFAPAMKALIILPLRSRQKLIGILGLETAQAERFSPDILNTLNLLAVRVAVAVDNARGYEELEQLVEELDAFDRTVAHDLKNPLSIIVGFTTLLVEDHASMPQESLHDMLEKVVNTAQKMDAIIDALLLLSRIRSMEEADIGDIDMAPLVQAVQERLSNVIEQCHAEIKTASSLPLVRGYAPWIEEVWSNYISNALKYGGSPPRIEIGGSVQLGNMARFWVRDNGPGLASEEQARLFLPFTRLRHAEVEGHGLGLSIVRRIVEKLGGQVAIESKPGEGSTFSFTLPLARASE